MQFVFIAKMVKRILDTFRPVDKALQDRTMDLLTATRLITATNDVILSMRSIDEFRMLWNETLSILSLDDDISVKTPCRRR